MQWIKLDLRKQGDIMKIEKLANLVWVELLSLICWFPTHTHTSYISCTTDRLSRDKYFFIFYPHDRLYIVYWTSACHRGSNCLRDVNFLLNPEYWPDSKLRHSLIAQRIWTEIKEWSGKLTGYLHLLLLSLLRSGSCLSSPSPLFQICCKTQPQQRGSPHSRCFQ